MRVTRTALCTTIAIVVAVAILLCLQPSDAQGFHHHHGHHHHGHHHHGHHHHGHHHHGHHHHGHHHHHHHHHPFWRHRHWRHRPFEVPEGSNSVDTTRSVSTLSVLSATNLPAVSANIEACRRCCGRDTCDCNDCRNCRDCRECAACRECAGCRDCPCEGNCCRNCECDCCRNCRNSESCRICRETGDAESCRACRECRRNCRESGNNCCGCRDCADCTDCTTCANCDCSECRNCDCSECRNCDCAECRNCGDNCPACCRCCCNSGCCRNGRNCCECNCDDCNSCSDCGHLEADDDGYTVGARAAVPAIPGVIAESGSRPYYRQSEPIVVVPGVAEAVPALTGDRNSSPTAIPNRADLDPSQPVPAIDAIGATQPPLVLPAGVSDSIRV